MLLAYLSWQFYLAPRWLLVVAWNIQRSLWQYFSVSLMLRTLIAHWHQDRVSYRQGTITGMIHAWAWNIISRAIGFFVRSCLLAIWLAAQISFFIFAAVVIAAFLLWPFLAVALLDQGLLTIISA
jgi:hypothetical protein